MASPAATVTSRVLCARGGAAARQAWCRPKESKAGSVESPARRRRAEVAGALPQISSRVGGSTGVLGGPCRVVGRSSGRQMSLSEPDAFTGLGLSSSGGLSWITSKVSGTGGPQH